ncbi:hypothetical protein [Caulobacter sp. 1776]|uniref:EF-Tu C-terminal domain-related protein n=1 Tax=Caulobacter sp. 1776 TaxID=3156420 RepID=UPI003398A4EA
MTPVFRGLVLATLITVPAFARASAATLPAGASIPARITLLSLNGPVGRQNPFYRGYRPTFVFGGAKAEVMCDIDLPGAREKVEPGETVEVLLRCIEPVSIDAGAPAFIFREGGRKVGVGELELPRADR